MPVPVKITLTANLVSILGGAELGGYLRVTLCGFGPQIPGIPGTGNLADAGVPQLVGPQQGSTPVSIDLYNNATIQPPGTFYEVAVLDQNKDVIQANNYNLDASTPNPVDLSNLTPVLPPFNLGFVVNTMKYLQCDSTPPLLPNNIFTAPGPVIAVAYNGLLLGPEFYSVADTQITLSFTTELGDRIDAFCIAH